MRRKLLWGTILPVVVLLIWELSAVQADNAALVPRLGSVAARLLHPTADLMGTGSFLRHVAFSAVRVVIGFFLAALLGVPLGLWVGRVQRIRYIVNPFVEMLRPLCPIAWIPFAMAVFKTTTVADLFGFHYTATIFGHLQLGMLFVIFYGGFFPVFLNTVHGVQSVKNIHIEQARLLGADRRRLFRNVILPSAMPAVLTGLRVGLGIAWMVIIAAEMMPGSDAGIGYLIMYSYELAEMDVLVASMVWIGVVGMALSAGLKVFSDRFSFWQAKER